MKDFAHYNPDGPLERKDASGAPADTVEIKNMLDGFEKTLKGFMDKTDEEIKEAKKGREDVLTKIEAKKMEDEVLDLKKTIEGLRLEQKRPMLQMADGTKMEMSEEQVEYKTKFDGYFRKGHDEGLRDLEAKTLSVGSDPDGGYTVPVQMETAIDRFITEISNVRAIARVVQVSTASYKRRTTTSGASSGWVGEQASRPNTDTPQMDTQEYPVMELYANPMATQSLLDDSAISIENWLAEEVGIEFAYQEGSAFVAGNGANKPKGFTQYDKVANASWTWGKHGYVVSGVSGDFADSSSDPGAEATNIIDLVYALKPIFRNGARFAMNRATVSSVMKLRDADGRPLWHTNLREGQPDMLMGYPISELEDMDDIGADSYSIAFGNFQRGYLIVDRIGTRVLRDPFSSKPYVQFYTTKRTGGGAAHYDALKFLKFGTS